MTAYFMNDLPMNNVISMIDVATNDVISMFIGRDSLNYYTHKMKADYNTGRKNSKIKTKLIVIGSFLD